MYSRDPFLDTLIAAVREREAALFGPDRSRRQQGAAEVARELFAHFLAARGWPAPFEVSHNSAPTPWDGFTFALSGDAPSSNVRRVDPARFGAAYERLILDPHAQGAYYTPPAEVDLMCREALRAFLERRFPACSPAIDRLLSDSEAATESPYLRASLRDLRVCDPALGAGAFTTAMLRHIVDARRRLGEEEGPALVGHILSRCLFGCDVDAAAVGVARLRLWLELAAVSESPPQFPDLTRNLVVADALREEALPVGSFDLVLSNPPYVRHQAIDPGMKAELLARYRKRLPDLDARSDLYVYFLLRGLELLRPGGVLCFVCSSSWLDTAFGRPLRGLLRREYDLLAVIDNDTSRSFATAGIQTSIVLVGPGQPTTTRFVTLRTRFSEVREDTVAEALRAPSFQSSPGCRVVPVPAASLEGRPWGAEFLRSPDLLVRLLQRKGGPLVPVAQVARIETYLNTGGADGFFIVRLLDVEGDLAALRAADGEVFRIEPRFLIPLLELRRAGQPILDRTSLSESSLVVIPRDEVLTGTHCARYVRWGEAQGFHRRSGTSSRRPWYALPKGPLRPGQVLWPCRAGRRHVVIYNAAGIVAHRFYRLTFPVRPKAAAAFLNSTFAALCAEVYAPSALGHGVRDITGETLAALPVLAPAMLSETDAAGLESALDTLAAEPPGSLQEQCESSEARKRLDCLVASILGLDAAAMGAIRNEACALVEARCRKARSLPRR